jgi:uncharacterized protein
MDSNQNSFLRVRNMSCCCEKPKEPVDPAGGCCGGGGRARIDWLLWISLVVVAAGIVGHHVGEGPPRWQVFCHGAWELFSKAWWGLLSGMLAVGVMAQVPKALVAKLLGHGGTMRGILRATLAGTLLDLCNHGILMVGMQLYRKGASLGQTIAFLVASPWNSLSLTLILAGLIGWKWMLGFVALSMVIGILAGRVADLLVARGDLPANPNAPDAEPTMAFREGCAAAWRGIRPGGGNFRRILGGAWTESRMILRWIFFGFALAAAIRAWVPSDVFSHWFGPTALGLLITLAATTVIEVCSEGSSPIAADLLNHAAAPGNAFTFLMAGAATDYTEIMALRGTTRSWKATLALPLLTTPQVLVVSWILNQL